MPAYATEAQFDSYVEGWNTTDPDALARLLERASRDIDRIFGPRHPVRAGTFAGFKLDPAALETWEAEALARATCAQAEHRFLTGEKELAGSRPVKRVKGPRFETEYGDGGRSGLYGTRVGLELEPLAHLRGLTARAR